MAKKKAPQPEKGKKRVPGKVEKQENQQVMSETEMDELVVELCAPDGDSRKDRCLSYVMLGLPFAKAAIKAGYKPSYAKGKLYRVFKTSPEWESKINEILQRVPERFRRLCIARLPLVADIEGRALELMRKQPELAVKHPQLLRQSKQVAGLLADDGAPVQQTININELRLLISSGVPDFLRRLPGVTVDAEDKE